MPCDVLMYSFLALGVLSIPSMPYHSLPCSRPTAMHSLVLGIREFIRLAILPRGWSMRLQWLDGRR
jgi:hypothetical protein